MKAKRISANAAMLLTGVLIVTACGNQPSKKIQLAIEQTGENTVKYPIPTAYEVMNLINRSGAAYIIEITNPTGKVESYLTESNKALNLGIYSADLAYVTTYNMKQETMDYLKAIKKLSDELHVSANFNADLAYEVERNIENKDTLVSIITRSFDETYSFLENNGKDNISVQVLTGMWVEGLYVAAYVATTSSNPGDLLQVVANQKQSLETLKGIIEKNSDAPEIAALLTLLAPIISEYSGVDKTIDMPKAQQIHSVVEEVRNKIIGE
ncbi:MAG: hypothetical protein LBK18_08780 [Prevotellaceae bacterium]|jgi:hypothetical protein|nr:hypothetical protein [Prevotellaceae bacterium]